MANQWTVNTTPATGALAVYSLLATLLLAGWTKPVDSDGSTYSSSGTQITGGGAGAHGLANNNAWFVLRDPAGLRSFCFQRGTTNRVWRVKYSYAAGFITPASTPIVTVPSATDEVVVLGSGSDVLPTFATMLPADGTNVFNCMAGDVSLGYSFWFDTWTTGNVDGVHYAMYLDVLSSSSVPTSDLDPAVVGMMASGNTACWSMLATQCLGYPAGADVSHAWFNNSGTLVWKSAPTYYYADAWQNFSFACLGPPANATVGAGVNSFSADDTLLPVGYVRHPSSSGQTGPFGWKGFGQLLRTDTKNRANGDTISISAPGAREWFYINGTLLPWNGSVPTL